MSTILKNGKSVSIDCELTLFNRETRRWSFRTAAPSPNVDVDYVFLLRNPRGTNSIFTLNAESTQLAARCSKLGDSQVKPLKLPGHIIIPTDPFELATHLRPMLRTIDVILEGERDSALLPPDQLFIVRGRLTD